MVKPVKNQVPLVMKYMCLYAYSGVLSIWSLLSMTDPSNVGVPASNGELLC